MQLRKNNPKNSPVVGFGAVPSHVGVDVVTDGGGDPDAALLLAASSGQATDESDAVAAPPSVASVANLERAREALILDVEGPLAFALWAMEKVDPDLYEGLALAAEQGMVVPDLIDVPRYRRVQVVADAVEAHQKRQIGGPCGACGAVVPPRVHWSGAGYLTSEEPSFHSRKGTNDGIEALCSWCHDYLGAGHTLNDLREMVGNAIGGVAASPGPGFRYRFAHRSLVPLFAEVEGAQPGLPWAHITPVQRRAIEMLVTKTVHPRRLILTAAEAERASLPASPLACTLHRIAANTYLRSSFAPRA